MISVEDQEKIRRILFDTYGQFVSQYMPGSIIARHIDEKILTEADLALHIWYTTPGGTTAAATAKKISAAIPGFVKESDLSTW